MTINLTDEQLNYILHYHKTKSVTTACDLATTLVEQVLGKVTNE